MSFISFLFLLLIGSILCVDYKPPIQTIRELEEKLQTIQALPPFQIEEVSSLLDFHRVISNSSISKSCEESLTVLMTAIEKNGDMWALQMVDADGKPGSGFFQGNTLWLGRYSECQDTMVKEKSNGTAFYIVDFGVSVNITGAPATSLAGKQGMCFPKSCNVEDVSDLANQTIVQLESILLKFNIDVLHLYYSAVEDVSKDKNFFGEISSVSRFCALVTFILMVFTATVLDLMGYDDPSETKTDSEVDTRGKLIDKENMEQASDETISTIIQITQDKTESLSNSLEDIGKRMPEGIPSEKNYQMTEVEVTIFQDKTHTDNVGEIDTEVKIVENIEVENSKESDEDLSTEIAITPKVDDKEKDGNKTDENEEFNNNEKLGIITDKNKDEEQETDIKSVTAVIETHEGTVEGINPAGNKIPGLEADEGFKRQTNEKNDDEPIQQNEGSMLKVLSDAGYQTIVENTMAEMGVDFMDGDEENNCNDIKDINQTENQTEDNAKSLEARKAKEEFSEEPSLRSFKKLTTHSREFSNILRKFKSFDNMDEKTSGAGKRPSFRGLRKQKSLNYPNSEYDKRKETEETSPLDIEEKKHTNGDDQTDIGEDQIDDKRKKVETKSALEIEDDRDIQTGGGEDQIDGIFCEDISDGEATVNDSEKQDELDEVHQAEFEDTSNNVEYTIDIQSFDEKEIKEEAEEENFSSSDGFQVKTSGWPTRLGGIAEIFANEESLEKCIEKESVQEISVSPAMKKPIRQRLNLSKCIKAFSAIRNMKKIFSITDSNAELSCLHGIRFISMTWVILGHTFDFALPYLNNPAWALDKIQNSQSMEAIEQGTFSVDSFFFLSGLLVSYMFLTRRKQIKSLNFFFWLKFIFHRFLRILPPYLALIVLVEPLMYYACTGPLCKTENNSKCYTYWWRNVLNINNLWDLTEMCAGWTWYLANDFQFFCLSPIFLVLLVNIKPLAWVSMKIVC